MLQYDSMTSWNASPAEVLYRQFLSRTPPIEQPMWANRNESTNWLEGSLSSTSSASPGSLSPLNSPSVDFTTNTQCSSSNDAVQVPEQPLKKIRNVRKSDKYHCIVCGDKPTGYHYDVLSCNGCKTFFRRTIINNRKFKCSKGGNCQFTKDFRCACRACRFNKCVKVGMNRTAIQFPTKIEDPEEDDSNDEGQDTSNSQALVPVERISDQYVANFQWVEAIDSRERAVHSCRRSDFPFVFSDQRLALLLREPIYAGKRFAGTNNCPLYNKDPMKFWMITDLFLVVEFAKTFDSFRQLSEDDQHILLSHVGGLLHVATQSYYSFQDAKSTTMTFPDGVSAMATKMKKISTTIDHPHFKNVQRAPFQDMFSRYYVEMYNRPVSFLCDAKFSTKEFAFFKTVALFSPDSTEMSQTGRETVAKERIRVTELLRKYLIAEYGIKQGLDKFSNILMALNTFTIFGEKRRSYLDLCNLMSMELSELAKDVYFRRPPQSNISEI